MVIMCPRVEAGQVSWICERNKCSRETFDAIDMNGIKMKSSGQSCWNSSVKLVRSGSLAALHAMPCTRKTISNAYCAAPVARSQL